MGASVNGPRVALITEFMSGGTLYARLHPSGAGPRPLPIPELLRVALCIARGTLVFRCFVGILTDEVSFSFPGMTYLHMRKPPIMHRDLKSLNILVRDLGRGFQLCACVCSVLTTLYP